MHGAGRGGADLISPGVSVKDQTEDHYQGSIVVRLLKVNFLHVEFPPSLSCWKTQSRRFKLRESKLKAVEVIEWVKDGSRSCL